MNTATVLLCIIIFILVKQFYPHVIEILGPVVAGAAVIYGFYWLVAKLPMKWRQRKATKRQEREDEEAFWEHQQRQSAIRSKYDPKHEWNESTSVPNEYLLEVQKLNLEYKEMLQRRNGWNAGDFL